LLAGTRPQANPGVPGVSGGQADLTGQINGDNNFVLTNGSTTISNPVGYFMPNGLADIGDVDGFGNNPPTAVLRLSSPVAGRWGESQAVPGTPTIPNPNAPPPFLNLVVPAYNNHIRAGYSIDVTDVLNGIPRDAADDNFNSFDPFPSANNRIGEVNDLDFLDLAGGYLLPIDRTRRYVTPADINGTGHIRQWDGVNTQQGPDAGADQFGRVVYSSYFRPPGLPGLVEPSLGAIPNAVTFPWTATANDYPRTSVTNTLAPGTPPPSNSNPLHGFEAQRFPNLTYNGPWNPQRAGGVPVDLNTMAAPLTYLSSQTPTYDHSVNGRVNSDGLNDADDMNI
jgi:hypothetical protein